MFHCRVVLAVLICFSMAPASLLAVNRYFLPQAAIGAAGTLSFVTQISMLNTSATDAHVEVDFLTDAGGPWTVGFSCSEDSAINETAPDTDFTLPAGAKYTLRLSPLGAIAVGWIEVRSPRPLQISATYGFYQQEATPDYYPLWEAAVLPPPSALRLCFAAHKRISEPLASVNSNTGFAIVNPNKETATVTAALFGGDVDNPPLANEVFTIPARGHRAQFINELFKNYSFPQGFRGTVLLVSDVPIAGLAMREAKGERATVYSTVPVEPQSTFSINTDHEIEGNNTLAEAQLISALPAQIDGTINEQDSVSWDFYKFHMNAGERLEVILLAGALGSPLRPVLQVRNSQTLLDTGEELYTNAHDLRASYTATAEGTYYIRISADDSTQGTRAFYRLLVRILPAPPTL